MKAAVDTDTAIVSLMWANNETGVIFPVEEAAAIAKSKGALFHSDAVQAIGKIPINMAASSIDMLSLSGHKLHAPKGIGVLYLRRGTPFRPFLVGGHQEKSRRAGTENAAAIIALGKACQLAGQHMEAENTTVKAMRDRLQDALMAAIPHARINGGGAERLAQYHLDRFRVCRRRSHSAAAVGVRHLRFVRKRLHFRVAGAFPRPACHGCTVHLCPRFNPLFAVALHYGCRDRYRYSGNAADHCPSAADVTVWQGTSERRCVTISVDV